MTTERTQPSLPNLFDDIDPVDLKSITHARTVLLPLETLYARADQDLLRILKEDKRVERKPVLHGR